MAEALQILLRGVDRFCPDCGRWLVHVNPSGSYDLAARTSLSFGLPETDMILRDDGTYFAEVWDFDATDDDCPGRADDSPPE